MTTSPRIHLAIDNCFASKRWTSPREWITVIKDLGISCIEASADNECDPLYTTPEVIDDWLKEVQGESARAGSRVVNLYSGHGTYATLGLSHPDERIRKHILGNWLEPMIRSAGKLGAGLGFFTHAFNDSVLQDKGLYDQKYQELCGNFAHVASVAHEYGVKSVGVEQMYSPHQVPWTLAGTRDLLRSVWQQSGVPFYITLDTGHQSGQYRFLRPRREEIAAQLWLRRAGLPSQNLWLGPKAAYERFCQAVDEANDHGAIEDIGRMMDDFPHLFSKPEDGDTYRWLEEFGCYSPIIHLQQTDGKSSKHLPFTPENNRNGIIHPVKVLEALRKSFEKDAEEGSPPRCHDIYLTLELFAGTADINYDILDKCRLSVEYWRHYVPEDGLPLEALTRTQKELEYA